MHEMNDGWVSPRDKESRAVHTREPTMATPPACDGGQLCQCRCLYSRVCASQYDGQVRHGQIPRTKCTKCIIFLPIPFPRQTLAFIVPRYKTTSPSTNNSRGASQTQRTPSPDAPRLRHLGRRLNTGKKPTSKTNIYIALKLHVTITYNVKTVRA